MDMEKNDEKNVTQAVPVEPVTHTPACDVIEQANGVSLTGSIAE